MADYLVAGATSGIGKQCLKELIGRGNRVFAVGRDLEKLSECSDEYGNSLYLFRYDLSDLDHITMIFDTAKEKGFCFDGFVYSAGMDYLSPIKGNSIHKFRELMDVNCLAFAEMGRLFYNRKHSNDGASIVAISSLASLTGEVGMMAYSASKAALNSVVKTMAKEFIRRGIRVNAILPAGVDTPMARGKNRLLGKSAEDVKLDQPMGLIPVEHVVREVFYLLSEDAAYVTGELRVIGAGVIR